MLTQKKCVSCEGGVAMLTPGEAKTMLKEVPGWMISTDGKILKRHFKFDDFAQALDFTNKIGAIAESEGHHPDLKVGWGYVEVELWTHAIGGLHENDFIV